MPPSKLYIKVKSLERLLKEESSYKQKYNDQKESYDKLSKNKNSNESDINVAKSLADETGQVLIPQLYSKLEQFENDLDEYLGKNKINIKSEVDSYVSAFAKSNRGCSGLIKTINTPLEPHRRNVKLNNDMTSNNEPLDIDEFEYMKERIINLFLMCADIKKRRYEEINAKSKLIRKATLEDAVNDDEIY